MKITGIIYLHEISQARMFGTARKNLEMFRKLCGDEALGNVVLGTTMWGDVSLEKGQQREQQLRSTYWEEMLQQGSVIMRVHGDSASAWEIVNHILESSRVEFVRIQEELLELQKVIPDTDAGRTLRYMLEELRVQLLAEERTTNIGDEQLRWKELEEIRKRMRDNMDEIQKLQVPLSERIKRFFRSRSWYTRTINHLLP